MSTSAATFRRDPPPPAAHRRAVGAMVRAARLDRGLSQGALGDLIGTSPQLVHYVETGRYQLPRLRIPVTARALGLDPAAFEAPSLAAQDAEEADLLAAFRHLPADDRRALLELVRR